MLLLRGSDQRLEPSATGTGVVLALLLKLAYQYNTRDGGRIHVLNLVAAQLLFWF